MVELNSTEGLQLGCGHIKHYVPYNMFGDIFTNDDLQQNFDDLKIYIQQIVDLKFTNVYYGF